MQAILLSREEVALRAKHTCKAIVRKQYSSEGRDSSEYWQDGHH